MIFVCRAAHKWLSHGSTDSVTEEGKEMQIRVWSEPLLPFVSRNLRRIFSSDFSLIFVARIVSPAALATEETQSLDS